MQTLSSLKLFSITFYQLKHIYKPRNVFRQIKKHYVVCLKSRNCITTNHKYTYRLDRFRECPLKYFSSYCVKSLSLGISSRGRQYPTSATPA